MDELIPVRVRDCPSDGLHPDGDFAYLKPRADLDIGMAVNGIIGRSSGDPDLLQVELGRVYLRFGIVRWDLHEADGSPWPLGLSSLSRLDWAREIFPMAEEAAVLYGSVFDPLVARLSKSSPNGPTGDSTSARRPSSSKRQKH